ncbi:hypothetical protein BGZ46_009474 [Entomortierella lignicola]|nr:hypothetical protein BGZ46_009474 [Entomortierella lignicola]
MSNTAGRSLQLTDLPDKILLVIFDHVASFELNIAIQSNPIDNGALQNFTGMEAQDATPRSKNKPKKIRVAGLGARTLCRLCCCSHRINHLASADQLWQPLTLARFSDRHWPTTDQKNLDLIRVRREHQLKLLVSVPADPSMTEKEEVAMRGNLGHKATDNGNSDQIPKDDEGDQGQEDEQRKKQKRTKFYSRFEQRAHRRKFGSLDPELKYTPLAWTNTLWSWKRTYFGDCRFVESEDVKTPNRIDHAVYRNNTESARQECERCWRPTRSCICSALASRQYCNCRVRIMILQHPRCQVSIGTIRILKLNFKHCQIIIGKDFKEGRSLELDHALADPNCTPLLLYPSHSAIDISTLASESSSSLNSSPYNDQACARYFCQECIHRSEEISSSGAQSLETLAPSISETTPYKYKLIIALDGSWSHAKIMYRCNPRLQQLTQIKFPNPPQSIYHELKPEPKPTYTSTAEAVGQAVALLGWSDITPTDSLASHDDKSMTDAQLLLEVLQPCLENS